MSSLPRYGERLGRYEIVGELGFGGTAAVYAGRLGSHGGVAPSQSRKPDR